jgi:phage baseplate assembly protein W
LQNIFTTNFGSRIMREYYGSFVPVMLGRVNINRTEGALFLTAVATAILQWEPRFHVTDIRLEDASRDGSLSVVVEGEYRPRATYGDLSPEGGARRVTVSTATGANWNITEG